MSIGCVICHEAFKSIDPADSYPMLIKECGHVMHSRCLKQWLLITKTCPTCRTVTHDNADSITRIHLQTVQTSSSAFSMDVNKLLNDMTAVKDKQIAGLREQLAEKQTIVDKLIPYVASCQKGLATIEVVLGTLGMQSTKESAAGNSSVAPVPAAAQPNNLNTSVATTRTRVVPSGSGNTSVAPVPAAAQPNNLNTSVASTRTRVVPSGSVNTSVASVPAAAQPNNLNTTVASTTPVPPRVVPSGSRRTATRINSLLSPTIRANAFPKPYDPSRRRAN